MKSKARRVIEKWVPQKYADREPTYLGEGYIFVFPGGEQPMYTVCRYERTFRNKYYIEWVCSCKGFFYSETDECRHVARLKEEWEAAS